MGRGHAVRLAWLVRVALVAAGALLATLSPWLAGAAQGAGSDPVAASAPWLAQVGLAPVAQAPGGAWPPSPWREVVLPKGKAPPTRFGAVWLDGQPALRIEADASYGTLVHALPGALAPGQRLHWRWRVDQANTAADLRQKASDDAAIKVCALFDLPLAQVPFVERQLLRLARSVSGEDLPAATVCYVWDAQLPAGTVLPNAYTRRVRLLVLRGAEAPLQRWQAESRDLAADFRALFGDEAPSLPPLRAVLVGADADNTRARSLAYLVGLGLD